MLTLYRRHRAKCKFSGRKAKCSCPIWTQGKVRGETVRESLDLTNWEAAQKRVRDWEIDGREKSISLLDAFERFISQHEANHHSSSTIQKHRLMMGEAKEFFGPVPLRSLSVDEVSKFRESWPQGTTTVKNKIGRLRSFFNFCIEREWIEKNPAKALKLPKTVDMERKPYTKDELEKIFNAVDQFPNWGIYGEKTRDRLRAFILILRWTGMRIGDVCLLEDAKIVNGQITIRTTKTGQRVSIPLYPEAQAALEKIKNGNRFYFWSGEGTLKSAVSAWERTMKRLYKICGFRAHCHRYRHNFATELLSKGVPISEVAAVLGNSVKMVEKVYGQWCKGRADALNELVKTTWA